MDVPEHCPGVQSESAGKVSACQGCPNQSVCSSGAASVPDPDIELVKARLSTVKYKILVLSGKGGVGKSTFTSLLARGLAALKENNNVAVLDVDICGPSMPRVMGVLDEKVHQSGSGWSPVFVDDNLCVMSVGFLLESSDDAVIWRGPKKNALICQFLTEVDWGEVLEYLVIDTPPGTSDEHLSIAQYLKGVPNVVAVVVTTPQEVSLLDVRKEINFLRKVNIPIVGLVENMSTFVCPKCNTKEDIFPPDSGGASKMADELNVPYLGNLPLDPLIARSCDKGLNPIHEYPESEFVKILKSIVTSKFIRNKSQLECPENFSNDNAGLKKQIESLELNLKKIFEAQMLQCQDSLKEFIWNVAQSIIRKMGESVISSDAMETIVPETVVEIEDNLHLPFRDVKAIRSFDNKLKKNFQLKQKFLRHLVKKCNVYNLPSENIKIAAPAVYSSVISRFCNWSGQRNKFPLKDSISAELLLEAVVKHSAKRHDLNAPNEAQKQLIVWFKNKSDIISRNMAKRHRSDGTSTNLTEKGSSSAEVEFHHSELSSSLPEFPVLTESCSSNENPFTEEVDFIKTEFPEI